MSKPSKLVKKREAEFVKDNTAIMQSSPSTVYYKAEFAPGRFVTWTNFNGREFVHVREFETIDNKLYPTKIGVSFTASRLKTFTNRFEEIDEQLKQMSADVSYKVRQSRYKAHLGAGIYVSVDTKFNGVDLRRHWLPTNQFTPVPTKNGIYIQASQWNSLKEILKSLQGFHPDLWEAEECFHRNLKEMLECRECFQF